MSHEPVVLQTDLVTIPSASRPPKDRPLPPERPPSPERPEEVVAAARAVAVGLAERADRHDRDGDYPGENIDAIWAAGLGNVNLPVESGGLGAGLTTTGAVVEALAVGDPATALIYVMHVAHLQEMLAAGGPWPAHLRDRVVADCLVGPALINSLRVEPELGSPSRGGIPATRARRGRGAGGEKVWRLSGRKTYSTGSYGLRWMMVGAAAEPGEPGEFGPPEQPGGGRGGGQQSGGEPERPGGRQAGGEPEQSGGEPERPRGRSTPGSGVPDGLQVGTFLVPGEAEGVEVVETWDHLGMRASASHDVVFHDVEIPLDHAVNLQPAGSRPAGARSMTEGDVWARALLLRIYLGVAKAGRDWLAGYLNERTPTSLGAPLASLPRFQAAMGEIEALIFTAEGLAGQLTERLEGGGAAAAEAVERLALVKVIVTGNVIKALEIGMALIGNPGLSYHHPLQRHYRNALCSRIHTPQDDVVLTAAGKAILDQAARLGDGVGA